MTEPITNRALNRATLERQFLLARVRAEALPTIEHLVGMQSQAPLAPYVGLWTRLEGFAAEHLSDLTRDRRVVRLHMMRNTIHLVSAADALDCHWAFATARTRQFESIFGPRLDKVDRLAVLHRARALLAEAPRSRAQLGKLLGREFPGAPPEVLAYLVTHHLVVCQVPPRGLWAEGGPPTWAPLDVWLGAPLRSPAPLERLVQRYLAAFGPATVGDLQQWSGLTRLGEVIQRCHVCQFRGEQGEDLYDLADAPRPSEDHPAPPRLLPEYDNLLLSHVDRSRFIAHDRPVPLPPGNGARGGTILIDGMWQGTWEHRPGALHLETFIDLRGEDRIALFAEASSLAAFLAPDERTEIALRQPSRHRARHFVNRRTCTSASTR